MKSNVVTCMASPFNINPLTIMQYMVITFCALHIVTLWICEINWIGHGANSKQCGKWEVFFYVSFYEVKTLLQIHYPFATCCAHVASAHQFYICKMHWLVEKNITPILLWWLGSTIGAIVGPIFAKASITCQLLHYVQFNGCFTNQTTLFWWC
jgi:CDP-diglyceride synthetase